MTHTEKDDLVERLGYHHEDQATGKLVLKNPDGTEAATRITELQRELAEAREALKPIAELFADAEGLLTPDYGEVSGRDFQMMTMHPDPEGLAADLRRAARALETTKPRI